MQDYNPGDMGTDRRRFLGVSATGLAGLAVPWVYAGAPGKVAAETVIQELYGSLDSAQRSALCLPFADPRRRRASANWSVVDAKISALNAPQQDLVEKILRSLTSEEGFDKFLRQMGDDAGGLPEYHIAFFGEPGRDFEFLLTGRHCTFRADGNRAPNDKYGTPFAGPMVYGHAPKDTEQPTHPGNVFWFQAVRANQLFAALDPNQRKQALADRAPAEHRLDPAVPARVGIRGSELSADQKTLLEEFMTDLLAPYRPADAMAVMSAIKARGGLDALTMVYYRNDESGHNADLGRDQVWDIWRLEGPGFVWHYRGAPHVHVWVTIAPLPPA